MATRDAAAACVDSNWPEAIRILTAMLDKADASAAPLLLCNRAFCNSKLELHRRVISDCDVAISKDCTLAQAYINKGHALNSLGKVKEALETWRRGYETAEGDLQLLLQLHALAAKSEKQPIAESAIAKATATTTSSSSPVTPPQVNESPSCKWSAAKWKNGGVCSNSKRDKDDWNRKGITIDLRVTRAVHQVNSGNYEAAISAFNQVLSEKPKSNFAFIGRGTAYAFQDKLEAAIADFTKAIEIGDRSEEPWKRRGQARAALGELNEALADFNKALDLKPHSPDVLCERGIVLFKLQNFEEAIKDLRGCIESEDANEVAHSYLGLALVLTGNHQEGIRAHKRALQLNPDYKEGWVHLAQSYQELAQSDKAKDSLEKAIRLDNKYVHAYHLLGLLHRSLGNHREAVEALSMGLDVDPLKLDCLYLRGSCYHAVGNHKDAVRDYEKAFDIEVEVDSERRTFQLLAFYQRDIAIYTLSRIDLPFSLLNMDDGLPAYFKEAWCKRLPPLLTTNTKLYRQQELSQFPDKEYDLSSKAKKLLVAADQIGCKVQYSTPGFLKNWRQHRMAGLAALEVARKVWSTCIWNPPKEVKKVTRGKRSKRKEANVAVTHNRGGICSSSAADSDSNKTISPWRDVYEIIVRWRQLSEPSDPVVWVDKLTKEEFKAGFGSHTPLLSGQIKVVRYYPNFQRAFNTAKKEILEKKCVYNAANCPVNLTDMQLKEVARAVDCADLYQVISEDFWLVTPCKSEAFEGRILDGTRLTLQKRNHGYEFSIRTPVTPDRWKQYDEELTTAWEALCETLSSPTYNPTDKDDFEKVSTTILKLTYYWYSFMPLARGTAICGYIAMLGLFLAAGFNVTAAIPAGIQVFSSVFDLFCSQQGRCYLFQVDWEAILSCSFDTFSSSLDWLYSSLKVDWSWQELPDVTDVFTTTGSAIAALSTQIDC